MMWNQNDTKYIIKRLVLYALISGIVFFGAKSCVKANVVSADIGYMPQAYINVGDTTATFSYGNGKFQYQAEGILYFTLIATSSDSTIDFISGVQAQTGIINDNNSTTEIYSCDIGTLMTYTDSGKQEVVYSVKCPIKINENRALKRINIFRFGSNGTLYVRQNSILTIAGSVSDAEAIASQTQSIVNSYYTNSQNEINAIQNGSAAVVYEIDREITSITNVQNSIDSQTQWQQQNFNVDTTQIDAITDLISTGDKNKIRDLMMFPARILMLIGAHIGSDYCTAYNLGSLYGTNLILPCINWKNYVGTTLYNTIDTILSIGIYIGIIIYLRKLLDYAFSLGATTFESVNVEVFK